MADLDRLKRVRVRLHHDEKLVRLDVAVLDA